LRDTARLFGLYDIVRRVDATIACYHPLYAVKFEDGHVNVVHANDRAEAVHKVARVEPIETIKETWLYAMCENPDCDHRDEVNP